MKIGFIIVMCLFLYALLGCLTYLFICWYDYKQTGVKYKEMDGDDAAFICFWPITLIIFVIMILFEKIRLLLDLFRTNMYERIDKKKDA